MKKGFTLIEIVISLTVFVIGILGVVHLFSYAVKSDRQAILYMSMAVVADNILDNVREQVIDSPDFNYPDFNSPDSLIGSIYPNHDANDAGMYVFRVDNGAVDRVNLEFAVDNIQLTDRLVGINSNFLKEIRVDLRVDLTGRGTDTDTDKIYSFFTLASRRRH